MRKGILAVHVSIPWRRHVAGQYGVLGEYDMPGIKTVDGIATGGGAKTAWFKDPEGNILAVSQRL
jgi:hypothetical protein